MDLIGVEGLCEQYPLEFFRPHFMFFRVLAKCCIRCWALLTLYEK